MEQREAFEDWFEEEFGSIIVGLRDFGAGNTYMDPDVQSMWKVWQAALQPQPAMGSGAEPVGYVLQKFLDESKTDTGRCSTITAKPWCISGHDYQIPVYTHPAPTAQDSRVPERWLKALSSVREYLVNSPASTGYCMCGSKVLTHGIGDGHSPVDEGDYHRDQVVRQIDAILSAAPSLAEKPQCCCGETEQSWRLCPEHGLQRPQPPESAE